MSDLEVLAPAGDEKSFFSAINNGANAIYLGLQNFNARNKAQNFNIDNLSYYTNIAHLYNVKIYLVVNTLVTDEEMSELITLVDKSLKAKVDAFIVQDLGVAETLKNTFKGINLHASTQMGIHSLQGALVAEKLGFTRIVLSREVTKQDIIDIKNNTNLEIEYFVHGALCVSFSGNCYLSSLCSNESGNRGRCLQPCRLKYAANSNGQNIKNGYLLSANDLCLIDKINMLKECGVTSFKIEGRLRRPSYVAYVTKMYSLACNLIDNTSVLDAKLRLINFKKLFNRGEYNTGFYLEGEPNKNTINFSFQNHRGIEIGKVKSVKPFKDIYEILIVTNGYEINKNDGLKCVLNNSEQSLGVGNVVKTNNSNEYIIYSKTKLKTVSRVYLTVDSKWEESLLNEVKKIKFNANFVATKNNTAKLTLTCGNVVASINSKQVLEEAKNSGLTQAEVKENLQKTKDTFFELDNLTCNIENVFMPKSTLNELRREALNNLQQEIIKTYEQKNIKPIQVDHSFFDSIYKHNEKIVKQENTNYICFNEETNSCDIEKYLVDNTNLVFSPCNYNLQNVKEVFDSLRQKYNIKKLFLNLPKVLRKDDYLVVEKITKSFNTSELGFVANNIGNLYFASLGYEVVGGAYLNITNSATVKLLNSLGVTNFVKSFENFFTLKLGLSFVGYPEVMTFCHCPYKTNFNNDACKDCKFNNTLFITGDNGRTHRVRRTKIKNCVFELLNSTRINLDKIKNCSCFIDLRT